MPTAFENAYAKTIKKMTIVIRVAKEDANNPNLISNLESIAQLPETAFDRAYRRVSAKMTIVIEAAEICKHNANKKSLIE